MKKTLIFFNAIILIFIMTFNLVSCSTKSYFQNELSKLFSFRDPGTNSKFLGNWENLLLENSKKTAKYIKSFNDDVLAEAEKWYQNNDLDLEWHYTPLEQLDLEGDEYKDMIYFDFEFPYVNDPDTPVNGTSVVSSTLGETEFIQIYNFKYLKNLGYSFKVSLSNEKTIQLLNSQIDLDGAIFFKGKEEESNVNLVISATGNNLKPLNRKISISNQSNKSNQFLQWRTFIYIKYLYGNGEIMQLLAGTFLVQIYAQLMYNATYNSDKTEENKVPLLDTSMKNMLFCASNFNMFINYIEIWPESESVIVGYGFYFSFNFYVHPRYSNANINEKEKLISNPLLRLCEQSNDFANTSFEKYKTLLGEN
ncbi:hypothetical protein SCORR_v1c06350 [Spiroplasma corruscae]|uniref:Uncharacterized protein n=1 Tax=Spiroplasma corruscae TaxID=216934 RepID=A0A222EPH1_9MOLU|nr:hypothetical protein [Spiroplasma corruscae]ASP28407.1 hypothetical protein SCORR_v1c06350 [Spiroplasma corruscae]